MASSLAEETDHPDERIALKATAMRFRKMILT